MMITKIHRITKNNPVRIQFTDGNVTRYIYSVTVLLCVARRYQ